MSQFNSQRRAVAAVKSNVFTVLMLITVLNLSIGTGYVLYRYNELYHGYNVFDFTTPNAPSAGAKSTSPAAAAAAPAATPAAAPAAAPATAPAN